MKLFRRESPEKTDEQNETVEMRIKAAIEASAAENNSDDGSPSAKSTKVKNKKTKKPYEKKRAKDIFSKDTFAKLRAKIPLGVIIAVCALPAVLTLLFYLLRPNSYAMHWVQIYISGPIRGVLAMLTSVYPFSFAELLIAFAIIWLIYYIIKSIVVVTRKRKWLLTLSKRLLLVVVLGLYVWSMFSWLWSSGYHAPGFADRYNFTRPGVAVEDLIDITRHFAERANYLAPQVHRGANGSFAENRSELFQTSTGIFRNISAEFPSLEGRLFRPKPMMFSWLMSRTGYSGMYFALTGEANINNMIHGSMLPSTLAHEHAHHLGVFSEDEANLVAILACVKSDNAVFAYSGYLKGLNYLLRALFEAETYARLESAEAAMEINYIRNEITESLIFEVRLDRWESFEFWRSQRTVDTGIEFIDTALTAVTEAVRETVDAVYDRYLRAQQQELGIQSYGAVVDLLVEYFIVRHPELLQTPHFEE